MAPISKIPRSVWMLGFVSLFMDISSELIHSLLPVFMVTGLGATMLMVGIVEGVAEATAQMVKVFSGTISDHLGRRKGLTVLGYGLGALSKPLFALALTVHWVFVARFMDRIGKGIRGAPRDALIADLTPPGFGARRTDCGSRWTPSALSSALCWRWRSCCCGRGTFGRYSGSPSYPPSCPC